MTHVESVICLEDEGILETGVALWVYQQVS